MTASTGTDERELFESAYSRYFPLPSGANNFMRDGEGYAYLRVQGRWEGFKLGRASLGAAQVPSLSDTQIDEAVKVWFASYYQEELTFRQRMRSAINTALSQPSQQGTK